METSFLATSTLFTFTKEDNQNQMKQQNSSTPSSSTTPTAPPQKKKRNKAGTPYLDAEVIELSPKSLMETNRFKCEVCKKGFQREQNLQLHRRGHNLPWKLKKQTNIEPKRKVYLCPEISCVHHDPSRALGDLTGIKKHYFRKHGEKNWKCEKCSKMYAVKTDWKSHSNICGTKEYKCDCGTIFSRRDSFITHRAFCDAFAQENSRQLQPNLITNTSINNSQIFENIGNNMSLALSQIPPHISSNIDQNNTNQTNEILLFGNTRTSQFSHILPPPSQQTLHNPPFNLITQQPNQNYHHDQSQSLQGLIPLSHFSSNTNMLFSENFNNEESNNFFSENPIMYGDNQTTPFSPHMSATPLLQKATQMGVTSSSCSSYLATNHVGFEVYDNQHGIDVKEQKMSNGGCCDGLTRDFHGSGQIVMRNMNGEIFKFE